MSRRTSEQYAASLSRNALSARRQRRYWRSIGPVRPVRSCCRRWFASAYSIARLAATLSHRARDMGEFGDTVDPEDIDRFAAQSASWWDPSGSFRPLHRINPVRIDFVRRQLLAHFHRDARSLSPFTGLRLADIGCGGGLIAEPMTRLGFTVTGLDADPQA